MQYGIEVTSGRSKSELLSTCSSSDLRSDCTKRRFDQLSSSLHPFLPSFHPSQFNRYLTTMGGASSKAARTLPKSTSSAGSSSAPLRGSGGTTPSARPPPGGGTASRPSPSQASGSSSSRPDLTPYQTADAIGQQGRQASPIAGRGNTGRPGQVGPIVERSEGGSERKTDSEYGMGDLVR